MNIQIISIFPEMFASLTDYGVVGRTIANQRLRIKIWNLRDFTDDDRKTVDDRPYGGGPGMVMMPAPLQASINAAKADCADALTDVPTKVLYLSPHGQRLNQQAIAKLAERASMIVLCGRYEGIDQRIIEHCVDEQWSLGDFVLSGGELAAMAMIDAIARLLPDSLGNRESAEQDSFSEGLLDWPHYTRPEEFDGRRTPAVLLSGDHQAIARWRMKMSLGITWQKRPDLLEKLSLDDQQIVLLNEFKNELI